MFSGKPTSGKRLAVILFLLAQFLLASSLLAQNVSNKSSAEAKLPLREGWSLQTSAKVEAKGEVISTPQFVPKGWHVATVPTTVVAALVKDKTFPDPLFGMNLRDFAGVNYPIGANHKRVRPFDAAGALGGTLEESAAHPSAQGIQHDKHDQQGGRKRSDHRPPSAGNYPLNPPGRERATKRSQSGHDDRGDKPALPRLQPLLFRRQIANRPPHFLDGIFAC